MFSVSHTHAQRVSEKLSRGVIALNQGSSKAYVGWRLLGTDPEGISFNLYRTTNGATIKIATEISTSTNFVDNGINIAVDNRYFVRPVINGKEGAPSAAYTLKANAPNKHYTSIPLKPLPDAPLVLQTNGTYMDPYCAGSVWVADVDGDGEWEYIAARHYEGTEWGHYPKMDCYELDGTLKWRFNFGPNAGSTANGTGFLVVADFDGDGKAEIATKTGEGSVFRYGSADSVKIGDTNGDKITKYEINISGPEFLSIIDGETGVEKARTNFEPGNGWVPDPTDPTKSLKDGYDRYGAYERPSYIFMAVAYLDGVLPSIVTVRGAGGGNTPAFAFDYRNGKITERWRWGLEFGAPRGLSQAHNILPSDLDNDGKDEILFLGSAIDDDGKTMYDNRDFTHGDHYRLMDMDMDRPGYEFFAIQQNNSSLVGMSINDAKNGDYIYRWYMSTMGDLSRGDASDFDPRTKGAECFSIMPGVYTCKGDKTPNYNRFPTRSIWWDDNLGREFLDGVNGSNSAPAIERWHVSNNRLDNRYYSIYNDGVHMMGTGGVPAFQGDIFGDWREELIFPSNDHRELRIFHTWDVAPNRIYCLMQNPMYKMQLSTRGRMGAASPDFYLGYGMQTPPPPAIFDAKHWQGNASSVWDNSSANWHDKNLTTSFIPGDSVLFDLTGNNKQAIELKEAIKPGMITVISPIDYVFGGSGTLEGSMPLTKSGKGSLTLNAKMAYSGKTNVWDGALIVNDTLKNSAVTVYGGVWGGPLSKGLTGGRIGGSGCFATDVLLKYGAAILPGNGVGSADTLSVNNLTEELNAVNFMDLSDDPTGKAKRNDMIQVNGTFTIKDTVTISLNLTNGLLKPGDYTLIKYTTAFAGDIKKIKLVGCENFPYTLSNTANSIILTIKATRESGEVAWSGTQKVWDLSNTASWLRNGNSDVFVNRDSVIFDDRGKANTSVYMATPLSVNRMIVDGSSNYTIMGTGNIAGTGNLIKRGTGTLRLVNQNSYTGKTIIEAGTLEITNLDDAGAASSIGAATEDAANFVLNGGATLSHVGIPTSTKRKLTMNAGDCTFNVNSGTTMSLLNTLSGDGRLVKTGAGILQLNAANTYKGGTIVKEGTLSLGSATANVSGVGPGDITLLGGKLMMIDVAAYETAAWNLIVPQNANATLDTDSRCTLTGKLTGAGNLTLVMPFIRTDFKGDWSAFTGTLIVSDGDFRIANSYGYANAGLRLVAGNAYTTSTGTTVAVGELIGSAGTNVSAGNWIVGSKNTNVTFAGTLSGTSTNFTKVGTGSWTINDTCTYGGTTTVNGGKLIFGPTGMKTGTGGIVVNANGTLGGVCKVSGSVTVLSGGTIAPGMTGIGTLTLTQPLVLSSGSTTEIEINKAVKLADLLNITSPVMLNGTLKIVKTDTTSFKVGDQFKIISATTIAGTFSAISPAKPAAGLLWDTSALYTTGTIGIKYDPSGINGLEAADVTVYPNPTDGKLFVTTGDIQDAVNVEVYSLNGVLLLNKVSADAKTEVDLSGLNKGVYLIKIITSQGSVMKQVIKK